MTYYGPWTAGDPTWWELVRIETFGPKSWYNGGSGNWVSYYSDAETGDYASAMEAAWDGTGQPPFGITRIGADGGGAPWEIGITGPNQALLIEMWMSIWRPASTDSYLPPPEQDVAVPGGASVEWEQGPRLSHRVAIATLGSNDLAPAGESIYVKMHDTPVGVTYDPGFLPRGTIAPLETAVTFSSDVFGYLPLDGLYPLFGDAGFATALVDRFTQTHTVPPPTEVGFRGFPYLMAWQVLHTPRYRFVYDGDPPTLTPGRYMAPARLSGRMDGLGPLSGSRRLDTTGPSRQSGFHPGAPGSYY